MTEFFNLEEFNKLASFNPLFEYVLDRSQRFSILTDLFRNQGNNFFKDIENGQPPVLSFKYEIIMDGRKFKKPVNYALTKIIDRRIKKAPPNRAVKERRSLKSAGLGASEKEGKRPIIIIDPRSGNGPGIAGSKKNSEIGMALQNGHPVYYIIFFPEPEKGQTLEDVKNAEIRFIKEVKRLHKDAPKPSIIGNSQAGWALAMLSAENPDLAGPMILNGSPISYWAGKEGRDFTRYRTAIMGGSWVVSLLSDLGNGYFDGAYLVSGYEGVDPGKTYFKKPYKLFLNADKNHGDYLRFARYWNSYYMMTEEEVGFMVGRLFIENSLEKGQLHFEDGKKIDLKDLKDPIVLFSSGADNITPPQQALNWITKVWGSEEEVKDQNQVIVYLLHEEIRHMGLFVSDKVAKKEHKGIIDSVEAVGYLSPGLYEMIIERGDPRFSDREYDIRFEARTFDDIRALDDTDLDELNFYPVVPVSYWNDEFYKSVLRPIVRICFNKWTSPFVKAHNPQRLIKYFFSDLNPGMFVFKEMSSLSKDNRVEVSKDNPFVEMEKNFMSLAADTMDFMLEARDEYQENLFKQIYGNPFVKSFFSDKHKESKSPVYNPRTPVDLRKRILKGGYPEAVLRMMVAVAGVDKVFDKRELSVIMESAMSDERLKSMKRDEIKDIIMEQSTLLNHDYEFSLKSLPGLIKTRKEKKLALELVNKVAASDFEYSNVENSLIDRMKEILNL